MAINVYWACIEKEWMRAEQPELVSKRLYRNENFLDIKDNKSTLSSFHLCPAVSNYFVNVYSLKSIFDYSFKVVGDDLAVNTDDVEYASKHVLIRSPNLKFYTFSNLYIFFTDEKSLDVSFYQPPIFESNEISQRCIPLPGKYDIGQWFRNTEFPFFLKKEYDSLSIKRGDVYSYMTFHTQEKINFIQFKMTDKLEEYRLDGFYMNSYTRLRKMTEYYKMFKNKKAILKEIKNNLVY